MATLDDAAGQLAERLRAFDSEIESSRRELERLRGSVGRTADELAEEWSALTGSVASFLERAREEHESVGTAVQHGVRASDAAHQAAAESAATARSRMAEGAAALAALARHAAGLGPEAESLASEAGELPARDLAERAREVEEQLAEMAKAACDLFDDEVASLEELAAEVRGRCGEVAQGVLDAAVRDVDQAFEAWERTVEAVEAYVEAQCFLASHQHARVVVDWALQECRRVSEELLDGLSSAAAEAARPLLELAAEVEGGRTTLSAAGAELGQRLEEARADAAGAIAALDDARDLLGRYSFVGA